MCLELADELQTHEMLGAVHGDATLAAWRRKHVPARVEANVAGSDTGAFLQLVQRVRLRRPIIHTPVSHGLEC